MPVTEFGGSEAARNRTYQDLAAHYGTTIIGVPAGIGHEPAHTL
jgi:hypothetical protein